MKGMNDLSSTTTPDRVESRIGTLEFTDGMPSQETLDKVYDHLDFTHAFEAFVNALQGVSMHAMHQGWLDAGVMDNEALIFSELLDAKSVILTANADTVYTCGFLDLTRGPMVLETPRVPRRHQRLLVPLGDRPWRARSRSRSGRQVSDPAARL